MGDRDVDGVREQSGAAAADGVAVGVPVRPEGINKLTRDVIIRIAWVGYGREAVLVTMRRGRGRGLLVRTVPLGELQLEHCMVPRLRVVR